MGLSAFNRAREIQAKNRAKNERDKQEQAEMKRQADKEAANAFVGLFPLDPENPDFVTKIIEARKMCTVLTVEQRELIDVDYFNRLDEATDEALNKVVNNDEPDEQSQSSENQSGTEQVNETGTGAEQSASPDASKSGGDNKPTRKRRGTV